MNTTGTTQTVVYNVTATTPVPASCTNTFTVTVTVYPQPIAGSDETVCAGSILTSTCLNPTSGEWTEHLAKPTGVDLSATLD